jgi:hypothetical protein
MPLAPPAGSESRDAPSRVLSGAGRRVPVRAATMSLTGVRDPTSDSRLGRDEMRSVRQSSAAALLQVRAQLAAQHIGKQAFICGQVASATFASRSRRQPTFLNLDEPYPQHIFTVVVWGESRGAFTPPPEVAYRDQRVCVTGQIREYRGRPEVVVTSPAQITIER